MTASLHLPVVLAAASVAGLLLFSACQSGGTSVATGPHAPAPVAMPALEASTPTDYPGLHNVVAYAPGVATGGAPEGREGLETLAAMGVKTIVSVDGATPDVATAQQLGMRYVHLPISYDTVTPERQRELAQALATFEQHGPVYMHCHHGKHRSAAALGSAVVLCGKLTPDQAQQRMKVSGTAREYAGLWQAVASAQAAPASALQADPDRFPSVAKVSGMVGTMAEIDLVIDLVKQAHKAGWKPPGDHPDLVPTKETKRLHTLYANLKNDQESLALPADYQQMLQQAIDASAALDAAVRAGDAAAAEQYLAAINKGCKQCHVVYRDQ